MKVTEVITGGLKRKTGRMLVDGRLDFVCLKCHFDCPWDGRQRWQNGEFGRTPLSREDDRRQRAGWIQRRERLPFLRLSTGDDHTRPWDRFPA